MLEARGRRAAADAHERRPFVAILGGAKVSDKLGVIEALAEVVDVRSSAAAWRTFLAAQGHSIGSSHWSRHGRHTCRSCWRPTWAAHPTISRVLGPGSGISNPDAGGEVRDVGPRSPTGGWVSTSVRGRRGSTPI
ncbi:MAG: phosphoglycerate kinase [Acidimicrobiales bacterium]